MIDEIFDLIKKKINDLNGKYKTIISDEDLKSAIKCIIKFILNPSKDFPLKDKTTTSFNGITTYNLDYNAYLWGNLKGKCIFDKEDGSDDKIILKLKKASVIENINLLKKNRGADNKNTLLQIAIDAVIEIITKRFKPLPSFYFNLENEEYQKTIQIFRANSSEIPPEETVSISDICKELGVNIFDKNGNVTDECMEVISKYIGDDCSGSSSPSRQLSELDLNYINSQKCKKIIYDRKLLDNSCGTEPNFSTTECRVKKIDDFEKKIGKIKTIRPKLPILSTLNPDSLPRSSITRLPPPIIPVATKGGTVKINILGRERKIINKNKKKYIRFNNELITISEAKKLNKSKFLNKVPGTSTQ